MRADLSPHLRCFCRLTRASAAPLHVLASPPALLLPRRMPFFQLSPPVIKVSNIPKPADQVVGTSICLVLRKQCTSLAQLCPASNGHCQYGIFSNPKAKEYCCPLSTSIR